MGHADERIVETQQKKQLITLEANHGLILGGQQVSNRILCTERVFLKQNLTALKIFFRAQREFAYGLRGWYYRYTPPAAAART